MSTDTVTVDVQTPAAINLRTYQGDTWAQSFRLVQAGEPVDLTGFTVAAQARDTLAALKPLTVTIIDAADGRFQVSAPVAGLEPDRYTYDVQADDAGAVRTWVGGWLRVYADVTP